MTIHRFPGTFLLFLCVVSFPFKSVAQTPASSAPGVPFQLKLIGPNVWAAIDDAKGDAGANAGFVIGDDGVAVIDTFENEAAAKAMLAEIRKLTKQPIKFVVNTHYHLDHVAGNTVFEREGAVVVGHHSLRAWIHTENMKFLGKDPKPEEVKFIENLQAPEVVFEQQVTLCWVCLGLVVTHLEGHTGGDSIVYIPDGNVVFCGDLFWRKTLPNLIDATTSAWIPTLGEITALPGQNVANAVDGVAARFVAGHGDVGTAEDVKEFQSYLKDLRAMVQKALSEGKSGEGLVAAVLPELTERYGKWDFFQDFAKSDILDMGEELKGTKRVPPREKK